MHIKHDQKTLIKQAINLARTPILISLIVTPVRYSLELLGIPEVAIFLIGLLWLTIGFSIYWGIKLQNQDQFLLLLILSLVIYSPISRIPVALAWWIDTKWEIGTHYGLYFNNFKQALLNHVFYGSILQIIAGFIAGSITFAIVKKVKAKNINISNG